MAAVLHQAKSIQRRQHTVHTTLCGRVSGRIADGMNIAEHLEQVTCKFCLRKRQAQGDSPNACEPELSIDLNDLVDFNRDSFQSRWVVASGDKRRGLRGTCVGTIGLRHAGGYEVVLQLDDGRLDTFSPMSLFPEPK